MKQILSIFFLNGKESEQKKTDGNAYPSAFIVENTLLSELFFVAILGIDSLNLLANQLHLVLQLLHLAIHLVNQGVTLLG